MLMTFTLLERRMNQPNDPTNGNDIYAIGATDESNQMAHQRLWIKESNQTTNQRLAI